jgi:hypothetical protein
VCAYDGSGQRQNLPQWIAAARDASLPGIAPFANGLEHDITPSPTA